jgi:UDP-2,4-diacetamido-2,4,6-trideoxy-beta-L-altropyranose hydrolase
MKVVFRVDASVEIGTGHVMRCLTLAEAIRSHGGQCSFVCKEHEGNLCDFISQRGFVVHRLRLEGVRQSSVKAITEKTVPHVDWLGGDWIVDARQTCALIGEEKADWVVVDHYAVDSHWEQAVRRNCHCLMVIDDLADRRHECDLLLDQNLGREAEDYQALLPLGTRTLLGPRYALLRPEFAQWRQYSLERRSQPQLKQLLITMGGVDQGNVTGQILDVLKASALPPNLSITVVMGPHAPWLGHVQTQAADMPRPTQFLAGISNMAELMAYSDLAIAAAGTTSWERCCLGLPTIMLVLAENQLTIAQELEQAGASFLINQDASISRQFTTLFSYLLSEPTSLLKMSESAAGILDGMGANRVLAELEA